MPYLFPGDMFMDSYLGAHEVTPIAPRNSLQEPPVLLDRRTNEPVKRAECGICMDRLVEIRSQCPIGRSDTESLEPCHHMFCYNCWVRAFQYMSSIGCAHCKTKPTGQDVFMGGDETYVKMYQHKKDYRAWCG